MKFMYHATPMSNLVKILDNGLICGVDNMVYMCERPNDAVKFVAIRGYKEILVCKIKILNKDSKYIVETFDHSEKAFGCRAFGYKRDISPDKIVGYLKYEL